MPYFDYHIGQHLYRPSNLSDFKTYLGETSTAVSPMVGTHVNQNFFNLAKSAMDNTTRITTMELFPSASESTNTGYIHYSGRQEGEGYFYGGNPLQTTTVSALLSLPHELGGASQRAFRIAAGHGIMYSGPGVVNNTDSTYRTILFGADGGSFATTATLLSYMQNKLIFNTKDNLHTYTVKGSVQLNTFPNWSTTFGDLTANPKSFWVYWNEGYTQVLQGLATVVANTAYATDGTIIGKLCLLNQDIAQNLNTLADTLRNAINNTIPGSPIPTGGVSVTSNTISITEITSDRTNNGIFQLSLVKDVTGDQGSNGVLEWLGWLPGAGIVVETYNYNSVINFFVTDSTSFHLGIQGNGPYITLAFRDSNVDSGGVTGFMSYYGITNYLGLNFHTRHPLPSYTKTLNFGGDLWTRDLYIRNLTVSGSTALSGITLTGTVGYQNLSGTGTLTTSGAITSSGTLTSNGNFVVAHTQSASLNGTVSLSAGTGNQTTEIGADALDILTINSSTVLTSPLTSSSSVTIGGIIFNSNTVTGISSATITTANITTANISTMNFSGNLGIRGTAQVAGTFNAGITNPPSFGHGSSTGNTNVLNYDGDFKTVTLSTIGNLFVYGSFSQPGAFDGSTTMPTSIASRVNFNGRLWATTVYTKELTGGTTTLSVDADGQIIRTPSDQRLKTDIQDIPYGLDTINQLSAKSFFWKDDANMGQLRSLGLIAQETVPIIPEIVNGSEDTYYGIDYQKLVPVLIKAIQELDAKVRKLEAKAD
jgi:hypothetical protein